MFRPFARSRAHIVPALTVGLLLAALFLPGPAAGVAQEKPQAAQAWDDRYVLPPESVQELFEVDKNYAVLDNPSPDGRHFLVPVEDELSTLEEMGRETLRLAMLELRPDVSRTWRLDTFGVVGLRIRSLEDRAFREVDLPDGVHVSDPVWSPEGDQIALLVHGPERTEVWTVEVATGAAERLSEAPVMATLATDVQSFGNAPSRILQWTPEGTVLTLLVPTDRGPAPDRELASGPIVRRSRPDETPTRTLPFLLTDPVDEALFRHHTTSQLAELAPGAALRTIGEPAMFESISLSPDGEHLLTERIDGPLSPIVGYRSFGRTMEVRDRDGAVVATVRERPLSESARDRGGRDLPREIRWIPDGGGLAWLQRPEREEDEGADAEPGEPEDDEDDSPADRVMVLTAPFDGSPLAVLESENGLSDLELSAAGDLALLVESRDGDSVRIAVQLDGSGASVDLTDPWDDSDPLAGPGSPMTVRSGNGVASLLLSSDGTAAWLRGPGHAEDFRPRPFVDRVAVDGTGTERVFEGSTDFWERPLVALDPDLERLVVQRESKTTFPDSWLWSRDSGFETNLTNNTDPFPAITAAERIDFSYTRRDGLEVQGRISMPVGWQEGERVPAIFWTYPSEYDSPDDYRKDAISDWNHNEFTHLSYLRWSDIWLTQGYALVHPDVPIVGDPYNDKFIQHLSDSLYAAIRKVDDMGLVDPERIGHGGHSYGAFATGNLLAHTPYFKAGIAGDGAYNRTLTPMGFQREPRFVWEALGTYVQMSPFFAADHIDTPLLMYHGADDNNSGTWPMQSVRMMQALTGLGKNAVLYTYPYESHGPRAIESYLDLWARWLDWFDRHVRGQGAGDPAGS